MGDKCDHMIGYSLSAYRDDFQEFGECMLDDEELYDYIDVKFDYCPWCGEEIKFK